MKNIVLTIVGLFSAFASAQNEENDWKKNNLYGKVKSVREISYEAVEKDGKIQKGAICVSFCANSHSFYNSKGNLLEQILYIEEKLFLTIHYQYDNKGYKMEENFYDEQDEHSFKIVFEYDKNGNLITESSFFFPDGYLNNKLTYRYDEKGRKIERKNRDNNKYETYQYNGNLTEKKEYYPDGSLSLQRIYQYDHKGNLTEETINDANGDLHQKNTYKYDRKGRKTERSQYNSEAILHTHHTFKYNTQGNLTEEKQCNPKNNHCTIHTFQYQYDPQGNWIKCVEFLNKKPYEITERVIEYF